MGKGLAMESTISIGRNIARMRKERRQTQEDLASFLGVTKASVSKWETGQSYPDIELLPRIATYFGMSIDDLVGYDPQMSRREIRATCARLRRAFAEESFAQAHEKCQAVVRDYYACYPLLVQIAALYLNHLDLADAKERTPLIEETMGLCERVRNAAISSTYIRQAESVEAFLMLASGNARAASELLSDAASPDMGADVILARAYTALGEVDKADETLQSMLYQALVLNLNRLTDLALLHAADPKRLELIHHRALKLIEAFDLEGCFVNIVAVHLAFAMAYVVGGNADGAIGCLEDYERSCRSLQFPIKLHGDEFFDRIADWLEETNDIGTDLPREEALVKQSMLTSVTDNPAFALLADDPRFRRIVKSLEGIAR